MGAFTNPPVFRYAFDGDSIYCVGNANTIASYFSGNNSFDPNYNTGPTFNPAAPAGIVSAYKCGSRFFIGGPDGLFLDPVTEGRTAGVFQRLGTAIAAVIPGGSAISYAIVECGDIFAGVTDFNTVFLLRYNGAAWVDEGLPFNVGGAPFRMEVYPLREGKVALWAKGVPEQGVYTYNYDEGKLHKITGVDPAFVQTINTSYGQ
jgi:hypothetical protein